MLASLPNLMMPQVNFHPSISLHSIELDRNAVNAKPKKMKPPLGEQFDGKTSPQKDLFDILMNPRCDELISLENFFILSWSGQFTIELEG